MAIVYGSTSVYRNTPMNNRYLDTFEPPITTENARTRVITLEAKYINRPDLLAHDMYGDANLWWVFTLFNKDVLVDPIYDMKAGIKLTVPVSSSEIGV